MKKLFIITLLFLTGCNKSIDDYNAAKAYCKLNQMDLIVSRYRDKKIAGFACAMNDGTRFDIPSSAYKR